MRAADYAAVAMMPCYATLIFASAYCHDFAAACFAYADDYRRHAARCRYAPMLLLLRHINVGTGRQLLMPCLMPKMLDYYDFADAAHFAPAAAAYFATLSAAFSMLFSPMHLLRAYCFSLFVTPPTVCR